MASPLPKMSGVRIAAVFIRVDKDPFLEGRIPAASGFSCIQLSPSDTDGEFASNLLKDFRKSSFSRSGIKSERERLIGL